MGKGKAFLQVQEERQEERTLVCVQYIITKERVRVRVGAHRGKIFAQLNCCINMGRVGGGFRMNENCVQFERFEWEDVARNVSSKITREC